MELAYILRYIGSIHFLKLSNVKEIFPPVVLVVNAYKNMRNMGTITNATIHTRCGYDKDFLYILSHRLLRFFHNVNIKRFYKKADLTSDIIFRSIVNQPFETSGVNYHFIENAFEDNRFNHTGNFPFVRL